MAKKRSQPNKPGAIVPAKAMPQDYGALLQDIKDRIRAAQVKAAIAVNRELLAVYWYIGQQIAERQLHEKWGNAVINRLGSDLQKAFPGMSGFSRTNVYRM